MMNYSTGEDGEFVRYWIESHKVPIFIWKVLVLIAIYPISYIVNNGNISTYPPEVVGQYILTFCVWGILNIFDVIIDKILLKFNIQIRRVF